MSGIDQHPPTENERSAAPQNPAPTDEATQLRRALTTIRRLRGQIEELERTRTEPLAIVGIALRVPGASTIADFWSNLLVGVDSTSDLPDDRWNADAWLADDNTTPGKMPSRHGGFITGADQFDAEFFGISPREAEQMDPQQRLLLMTTWEALEDAGIPPERISGSDTGVFLGIGLNDYGRMQAPIQHAFPQTMDNYAVSGNVFCIAANRISYILNLHGPSLAIDTACSSSLVAMHQAIRSLRQGECSLALVGGSNLILAPENSVGLRGFLSTEGRCKFGDASADGFGRGEGVIMTVVTTLAHARARNLRVYAVVRGSAINQDGFSSGLTVPNGLAQQAMLEDALRDARVAPADVAYVEAHGTGTRLGDPIEVQALGRVLGRERKGGAPLYVGSVKSNINHLEAAAGIAGVVKTALSLHHGVIPRSLHYETPNPFIDFDELGVQVISQPLAWNESVGPRIAGVSSFGFGGVNAHVILEGAATEAQPAVADESAEKSADRTAHLLTLSAKSDTALRELAQRHLNALSADPALSIADYAWSANTGRSHLPRRLAIPAGSREEMLAALQAFIDGEEDGSFVRSDPADATGTPIVAFLFTGQGSQYAGMVRGLYAANAGFRADIDRCIALAAAEMGIDLSAALFAEADSPDAAIHQTRYTQPALFAVEYALALQWMRWGIQPAALLGHSLGEYAAAVIAGVFTLEEGMRLVAARATLMQQLPADGAMAAIFAPAAEVEAAISTETRVAIAAYNGPEHVVISGDTLRVGALVAAFEAKGHRTRRLTTSHAFHSPLIEPMQAAFKRVAEGIDYKTPTLPLLSNVTGTFWAKGSAPNAAYWTEHLRQPVRFAQGMQAIHASECNVFIEIGPAPVLTGMGSRILPDEALQWLPSLRKGSDDWTTILASLAACYTAGAAINWLAFDHPWQRTRVSLPTYPFQTERYWFDSSPIAAAIAEVQKSASVTGAGRATPSALRPLVNRRIASPLIKAKVAETTLALATHPWLGDHRAFGEALFPAAGYVELLLEAADVCALGKATIDELLIHDGLVVDETASHTLQTVFEASAQGGWQATIHAAINTATGESDIAEPEWRTLVSARLMPLATSSETTHTADLAALRARLAAGPTPTDFYARMDADAMRYRGAFQGIDGLWSNGVEAVAQLRDEVSFGADYLLSPPLLDAALQPLALLYGDTGLYLPFSMEGVRLTGQHAGGALWSHVRLLAGAPDDETLAFTVSLHRADGESVLTIDRLAMKRARSLGHGISRTDNALSGDFYHPEWVRAPHIERAQELPADEAYIIVANHIIRAEALASCIRKRGSEAQVIAVADVEPSTHSERMTFAYSDQTALREAVRQAMEGHKRAHLLLAIEREFEPPAAQTERSLRQALQVLHAVTDISGVRLSIVTRAAQVVTEGERGIAPLAALAGFVRVAVREMPDLHVAWYDLDHADAEAQTASADLLLTDLSADADESEVAYRDGERFVRRLARVDAVAASHHPPVRLAVDEGASGQVRLLPFAPPTPGADEVLIEVRATGLNFRDVLVSLGMYPGNDQTLGHECAGVVAAVGADVSQWQPGDEVIAISAGSMATHALAHAALCVRKPAGISFVQGASLPIAYLTAAYALEELAQIKPGDKVLIHAAAGGVGLAAVAITQAAGATVFATAGSHQKRDHLALLDVKHIYDSRTLDFADEILRDTDGAGVDVILNSLSGDFIPASLRVLRKGGVFLEIGKRGIWSAEEIAQVDATAAYHVIYLGDVYETHPAYVGGMLERVVSRVEAGTLHLSPVRCWNLDAAETAFKYMAQARHIGKIVLTPAYSADSVRADATYLITGGLGAIGLALAQDLVARGARSLVLAGRSAPSAEALQAIEKMRAEGATVLHRQMDVAEGEQVEAVVAEIARDLPPLRGMIHAAGLLDDGILLQQTLERFARVLAPKVRGALNLVQATRRVSLDFLLLLSAGAALLGKKGQAGYAAANAFLDAFAAECRRRGIPAISINLGAWAEGGMSASSDPAVAAALAADGLLPIERTAGLDAIHRALEINQQQLAILPIDWRRFFQNNGEAQRISLLRGVAEIAHLENPAAQAPTAESSAQKGPPSFSEQWSGAVAGERSALVKSLVRQQIGKILRLPEARVLAPKQPLVEIGFDSLMAVELRNSLRTLLQVHLPTTLLFDYPTPDALAHYLETHLAEEYGDTAPVTPPVAIKTKPAPPATTSATLADIREMSDEEAERLLLQELEALQGGRKS